MRKGFPVMWHVKSLSVRNIKMLALVSTAHRMAQVAPSHTPHTADVVFCCQVLFLSHYSHFWVVVRAKVRACPKSMTRSGEWAELLKP